MRSASGGIHAQLAVRIHRRDKGRFCVACFRGGAHPDGVIRSLVGIWVRGISELSPEDIAAAQYRIGPKQRRTDLLFRCDDRLYAKLNDRAQSLGTTKSVVIRALAACFAAGRTDPDHRQFALDCSRPGAQGRGWKRTNGEADSPLTPPKLWPVYRKPQKRRGAYWRRSPRTGNVIR